jgi:hypothetical protein
VSGGVLVEASVQRSAVDMVELLHNEENLRDASKQETEGGMMSASSSPEGEEWRRWCDGEEFLQWSGCLTAGLVSCSSLRGFS